MKPNDEQIQAEIEQLKKNRCFIRQFAGFGEDNWSGIDVEIDVLENKLNEDNIYDKYSHTDFLLEAALGVLDWMAGEDDLSPSENWGPLVRE